MTRRLLAALLFATFLFPVAGLAQSASDHPFVVEYYYKAKWGHADEFLKLFKKNHYPLLKALEAAGHYSRVRTYVPTYHGDGRADWTFAVSITYRDINAMTGPSGEDEIIKKLFPDQERYRREEQRRFELLEGHWDVPLNDVDMDTRKTTR